MSKKRDYSLSIIAEMFGVTVQYVAMVRDGKRKNAGILAAHTQLKEDTGNAIKSAKESIPKEGEAGIT